MPRPKRPGAISAPPAGESAKTGRTSVSRKPKQSPTLTRERIADDMDAFRKSGGKVEVLGTTRTLTRIDADPGAPSRAADPPTRKRAR
ncbi:hypothetical protein E2F46_09775 [Luteimonas aestuarii]|uniref:Uncharacterized protein n=1 Tax=Luteimonas aestuarii TaxID=453837 RepID=A0A4R5TSZ5_9GAMM|nr:hypothetical protein [Luteimonas aestuarii]TDK23810.1 hypothetical protein E2F46_09775 [Luteimonas aestuarii]